LLPNSTKSPRSRCRRCQPGRPLHNDALFAVVPDLDDYHRCSADQRVAERATIDRRVGPNLDRSRMMTRPSWGLHVTVGETQPNPDAPITAPATRPSPIRVHHGNAPIRQPRPMATRGQ
jgi:hypothetical protein